jgi:phage shock protein PspC (stress-responsive transcriptional regulator)
MHSQEPTPKLTKSADKRWCGVCGGIAEFVGWRPGAVRGIWFFATLLTGGGGLLLYFLLALVMPPARRPRGFDINEFRVQ